MPTYTERNIWEYGDASTLTVVETPFGRVGGLICWEHWMPLTRFAMHQQVEHVHVAAWPEALERDHMACRTYAFQGNCVVICTATAMKIADIPMDFELRDKMIEGLGDIGGTTDFLIPGGSGIIGPDGEWIAGPVFNEETIVYAEVELSNLQEHRLFMDVVGHSNRPDLFRFEVDDQPRNHATWKSENSDKIF